MENIVDVRVLNSEINSYYSMPVRSDRLAAFLAALADDVAQPGYEHLSDAELATGVSGSATLGMNTIFTHIPQRFPVIDILRYLRRSYYALFDTEMYDTQISLRDVEAALARFAATVPTVYGDGSNVH